MYRFAVIPFKANNSKKIISYFQIILFFIIPDKKYNDILGIYWIIFDPRNCPLLTTIQYRAFYNMIGKCPIKSFHLIVINANPSKHCIKSSRQVYCVFSRIYNLKTNGKKAQIFLNKHEDNRMKTGL